MPQLDTFGFCLGIYMEVRKNYCKVVNGENVWSASGNVGNLAAAFPALQHFKVLISGLLKDTHVLDARFMSKALFPKLRGVTCCSAQLNIVFRNLSPSCYLVNKSRNQYLSGYTDMYNTTTYIESRVHLFALVTFSLP